MAWLYPPYETLLEQMRQYKPGHNPGFDLAERRRIAALYGIDPSAYRDSKRAK